MMEDMPEPLPPPRTPGAPYRVCCVCLGNICRSPMAEAVLREQLAKAGLDGRVLVDSAGTGDWHVGGPMHGPARARLDRGGYDGSAHRARQFDPSWLADRDLVLAMDAANLADLRALVPPGAAGQPGDASRIRLFGEVAGLGGADVPDPYYGTDEDFARVLAMLEAGLSRLVAQLAEVTGAGASAGGPPA